VLQDEAHLQLPPKKCQTALVHCFHDTLEYLCE
jgi:hypothetical protein